VTEALQALLDGLMIGGVYAVISIGLTLVFGVMGIVNFAQAEFLMLGMFVAYYAWAWLGLDPLVAAPLAFAVVFCLGAVVHHLLIRKVLKAPEVAQIFLTVGLLIVLENAALLMFGAGFKSVTTPYQTMALRLGPFFVSVPYLAAFLMSGASGMVLWLFLGRSWFGRAMRATAQDPMAARLMGINSEAMHRTAFALGVGLTAFGGAVILPYLTVSPDVGEQFVVLMFTVVVLGGLGSVIGAVVGGLAVGMIQSLSALAFPIQMQNLVLFVVFIGVLAFRPEGLLGRAR
jgi:branched-chain amino acid transport system permease protein